MEKNPIKMYDNPQGGPKMIVEEEVQIWTLAGNLDPSLISRCRRRTVRATD